MTNKLIEPENFAGDMTHTLLLEKYFYPDLFLVNIIVNIENDQLQFRPMKYRWSWLQAYFVSVNVALSIDVWSHLYSASRSSL